MMYSNTISSAYKTLITKLKEYKSVERYMDIGNYLARKNDALL